MNIFKYIELLIPIRFRRKKIEIIAKALCSWIKARFDAEEKYVNNLILELGYTSSTIAFVELLNRHFGTDGKITITNGRAPNYDKVYSNTDVEISIWNDTDTIIRADEDCFRGSAFVINIPNDISEDQVRAFVQRYIFIGKEFEIKYI